MQASVTASDFCRRTSRNAEVLSVRASCRKKADFIVRIIAAAYIPNTLT